MADYIRAFTTTCHGKLLEALNSNDSISQECTQIIDTDNGNITFQFASTLTVDEELDLDNVLGSWTCPDTLPVPVSIYVRKAYEFINPVTNDYTVSVIAPAIVDPDIPSMIVRAFDDGIPEGIATVFDVSSDAKSMALELKCRARTAPASSALCKMKFYARELSVDSAIGAWASSSFDLPFGNNDNFTVISISNDLSSWNLEAGKQFQIEIARDITDVGDDLVGDMLMFDLTLKFYA
jgi:hypothetical protein